MYRKNTSIFFNIFILSFAIFAIGIGPWSSDILAALFDEVTKHYILIISGSVSLITFILHLSEKNKSKRSIKKLGNNYYTQSAADFIKKEKISPETVDNIIKAGSVTKRSDSLKYTWTNSEGIKYIIITNTKGIVSEVAR